MPLFVSTSNGLYGYTGFRITGFQNPKQGSRTPNRAAVQRISNLHGVHPDQGELQKSVPEEQMPDDEFELAYAPNFARTLKNDFEGMTYFTLETTPGNYVLVPTSCYKSPPTALGTAPFRRFLCPPVVCLTRMNGGEVSPCNVNARRSSVHYQAAYLTAADATSSIFTGSSAFCVPIYVIFSNIACDKGLFTGTSSSTYQIPN